MGQFIAQLPHAISINETFGAGEPGVSGDVTFVSRSKGARIEYRTGGFGNRPFYRLLPVTVDGDGASALGQFLPSTGFGWPRLSVRWLCRVGLGMATVGDNIPLDVNYQGFKVIYLNTNGTNVNGSQSRVVLLLQPITPGHWGLMPYVSPGSGGETDPNGWILTGDPALQDFYFGDGTPKRGWPNVNNWYGYTNQWVCLETSLDLQTHRFDIRFSTEDGRWNSTLYASLLVAPNATEAYIDMVGSYMGREGRSYNPGPEHYIDVQDVVITETPVGPPADFGEQRRIELTPELSDRFTMPNETTLVSLDGETEIGDAMQAEFYPQVKRKAWDNECNISLRLVLQDYTSPDRLRAEAGEVVYRKGDTECRISLVEGGANMDVVLASRPTVNALDFSIETKSVVLEFQPPLDDGLSTDQDQIVYYPLLPGQTIPDRKVRPVHAINSLAIYHVSETDGDYQTGKVGHLFRMKATDANNNTAWCDWSIVSQNLLRLTIPQSFIDSATYPVRVGDWQR